MANPHRQEKLGGQIANEVSDLLRTRIKDPRVGFASVTHVEVSGDLRHAKIFVSVMGDQDEKKSTIETLHHATSFLRRELAGRLNVRFMPEILFKLDNSIEQGSHILGLIRQSENEAKLKQTTGKEAGEQAADEETQAPATDEVVHESD